ncbi:MAG: hypothetical protein AB7E47_16945 [Desulfovibrionaceae bacterium]
MERSQQPEQGEAGQDAYKVYDLIALSGPEAMLQELRHIGGLLDMHEEMALLESAIADTVRLFGGSYPGYRASNTAYHDLGHTASAALTLARLMHGSRVEGAGFPPRKAYLVLVSALFHDAGLIQTEDDTDGTGAKYTVGHELRSITFVQRYLSSLGFSHSDIAFCANAISATMLALDFAEIPFESEENRQLGRMLGTADLLAQMADRLYLEKLLLLYMEFREARLPEYRSAYDLLVKTDSFYNELVKNRLSNTLGGVDHYQRAHFRERWGVDRQLYAEYIVKNIKYLTFILNQYGNDYRAKLRRGGILQHVEV